MKNHLVNRILYPVVEQKQAEITCEKHGKVTGIVLVIGEKPVNVCPICEAESNAKEEEEGIRRQAESLRRSRYESYREKNIEPEYFDKELSDYKADTKEQAEALEAVKAMIENKRGKVILLGSNGVGKTFLGSMAVKALGGKIFSMYEISTMIRQSYTLKAQKTELEIVQELASIPLLVIDEMGRTKGSDAELNWLSFILDKRHTRNLPFMILSNTHLSRYCEKKGCDSCFERFVNNDVLSRLRQDTKIITIEVADYRGRQEA